ncbi:hypothetical protein [Microlunatus ginsengisoli]|uniref:Uncharacterized protein n=1 Tax=Microlunatus ginsengisoli TaxID=363863 RepID=A0ABP6ZP12_9ACTN
MITDPLPRVGLTRVDLALAGLAGAALGVAKIIRPRAFTETSPTSHRDILFSTAASPRGEATAVVGGTSLRAATAVPRAHCQRRGQPGSEFVRSRSEGHIVHDSTTATAAMHPSPDTAATIPARRPDAEASVDATPIARRPVSASERRAA